MPRLRWICLLVLAVALAAPAMPADAGGGRTRAGKTQRRVKGSARARPERRLRSEQRSKPGRRGSLLRRRRRLSRRPARRRHVGRLLESPAAATSARLDMLAGARQEILLSSYIFANDRVGRMAMAKMRAAARAGKKVKLLIDGVGHGLPKAALAHLAEAGVEIGVYNPTKGRRLLRPGRLAYRMHDKLLVVDGESMIVGGRNMEEGYFGYNRKGYTKFTDVEVQMSGPTAGEAREYFFDLWNGPLVEKITPGSLRVSRKKVARYERELDHYDRLLARGELERFRERWKKEPEVELSDVSFFHENPTSLENPDQRLGSQIVGFLDRAESEVEIQTPYLVPTPELLEAIARARERGVEVRFLTNSLQVATGHERLPQWAYESMLAALADAGAEVWEHRGKRILHAKTAVIDRHDVFIGSFNQDPRSRHLQKEVGVLAKAPELARGLLARGERLRETGLLAARDGKITDAKKRSCRWFCRSFARYIFGPLARATGLYNQL